MDNPKQTNCRVSGKPLREGEPRYRTKEGDISTSICRSLSEYDTLKIWGLVEKYFLTQAFDLNVAISDVNVAIRDAFEDKKVTLTEYVNIQKRIANAISAFEKILSSARQHIDVSGVLFVDDTKVYSCDSMECPHRGASCYKACPFPTIIPAELYIQILKEQTSGSGMAAGLSFFIGKERKI